MATGFRPKSERIIELAGYSSEELMLLAIEASKHLGWQAGNIKSEEAEFYTSASLRSWQEKVVLSVIDGKDGQLLATSVCTSMQLFDWGKNKQNLDKLIAAMQQVQNSHNMPSNVSKAVDNTACAYTLEEQNTVLSHIRHFYGGIKGITKSIVSPSGVEILIIEPTSRFDCYTLVTCGVGASVMPVPDKEIPSRCEFCMCMPPTWNTEDTWPTDWLLRCASWLQQGNTWITCGHSLSDGTPLHDDTSMTSLLLTIPEERDSGAENCQLPNGDSVAIYQLIPVYTEEVLFKQVNGIMPLLDKMKDVSYIVDTDRENTCRDFSAFEENKDASMSMDEKANASLRSLLTIRKGNIATPLLTYINVALFVIMAICGVSLIAPTGISIIKWGADFGPLTLTGDWWRTVTCNFIHIGVIHILMNMYALLYIGVFLEQLIGGRRLISAYLLTGLFSALASLTIHPEIISAGASGSIFGLYGIFLSYLIFHHKIEKGQRKSLLYSIGFFVFYNLTSGIRVENIDNAAHIGGLISGVVLGILYLLTDRYAVKKASTLCTSLTEISFVLIFAFLFAGQTSNLPADFVEIRKMWDNGTLEQYAQNAFFERDAIEAESNASFQIPQNTTDVSTFTGSETDLVNGMKEYVNSSCGFSCQYPSTWKTIKKSDTKQILQLQGDGVNSLTVSYLKAPSEEAMEHMHDLLTKSMEEFRVENINIHGKVFEKVSGKMECAVAGGGNIYINQNIVIHMNKKTLESFIIATTTSDDSSESEILKIVESIKIN